MKGPVFEVWSSDDDEPKEPIRTRIQRKGVGIIEKISFDDGHTDTYCPKCSEYGFKVKLTNKILMPGEVRQPDYDQWLQCPSCAEIIAAYVVEHDATIIRDDIETVETPFESNQSEIIGANPKRNTKAGQRLTARRKRNRTKLDDDPEIDSLLRIYGDRVTVHK